MKEIINTKNAPQAIGPYVQAIKTGNIIYVSGQIPLLPSGVLESKTISTQTTQVMKNLTSVLEAAGSSLNHVIKTTCYITDMNNFTEFNNIYNKFFNENYPARACIEVSRLPKDVLIEIDAIALEK